MTFNHQQRRDERHGRWDLWATMLLVAVNGAGVVVLAIYPLGALRS
jgi:hypothetical protein